MAEEPNYPDLIKKLEGQFGGRVGFMGYQILTLSQSGQPCDITRYNQQPLLDVVIDPKIAIAMMYGVGPAKLMQLIDPVPLADGRSVSFNEIWNIVPMPKGGISSAELAAVDLAGGDVKGGPNGRPSGK